MCVALLPRKGDGDGRAAPATAPTPIRGFPELRPPTRQPGWVPRETVARRRAWVSVARAARGCSRWGDCRSHLGCHLLSAPALAGHPLASSLWGRLQPEVAEKPPLALRAGGSKAG